MGTRGPAPKRSDQRRRRNKPAVPTSRVEIPGVVPVPPPDESWDPRAVAWYESLAESGQSRFYEPADWRTAHLCASLISDVLREPKAAMVQQIRGLMTDLLVTEGARRRVSLELERPSVPSEGDEVVAELDAYRRRTGSGAG